MDCVNEIGVDELNQIKLMAIAVRGSKVKDFDEFLDSLEGVSESITPEEEESLHEKNMKALKG